jgi:chromosome segregation ATPase
MADTDKKDAPEMGLESSAFEALERDFQEVLTELVGDKSLERFRVEYEKLHRALKKSHESEKRLIKKCRELNSEIVSNAAKVQAALKHSQEDREAVASLRKEMDKAWKMVEASHEKENRAKETIQQLKLEISNLSRLVEQGAGLTLGQENTVNDLMKQKEELMIERDGHIAQIVQLRNEANDMQEKYQALDDERMKLDQETSSLKEALATKKAENDREVRRKERLEKELKEVRIVADNRASEIKQKQTLIQQGAEQIARQDLQLRDERANRERAQKEIDTLTVQKQTLQHDLEDQISTNNQLLAENNQRMME